MLTGNAQFLRYETIPHAESTACSVHCTIAQLAESTACSVHCSLLQYSSLLHKIHFLTVLLTQKTSISAHESIFLNFIASFPNYRNPSEIGWQSNRKTSSPMSKSIDRNKILSFCFSKMIFLTFCEFVSATSIILHTIQY